MKNNNFLVKNHIGFWISIIFWLFGWSIIVFYPRPFFKNEIVFSKFLDNGYILISFLFSGFFGPLATLIFSLEVQISENTIFIKKFFGIIKKKYLINDVVKADLISAKKRDGAKIKIQFTDGFKIKVDSIASNFKELWKYFGGDEKDIRKAG